MKGIQEQQASTNRRKKSEIEPKFKAETPLTLRKVMTSLKKTIDNSKEERKGLTYDKYKGGEERRWGKKVNMTQCRLGEWDWSVLCLVEESGPS